MTRILAKDEIGSGKNPQSPNCDIVGIADRNGSDVKPWGEGMLAGLFCRPRRLFVTLIGYAVPVIRGRIGRTGMGGLFPWHVRSLM